MSMGASRYRIPGRLEGTVLGRIVSAKMHEIAGSKHKWGTESIRMALDRAPEIRPLRRALLGRPPAIIAELKKASPSAGLICPSFDPESLATQYQDAGAAAISVVTEAQFFQGNLEFLARLRWTTRIPLLRKDFIVDPYQIHEARHAGADAVLLIAALHDLPSLKHLCLEAGNLGMDTLVEVHDEVELERSLAAGATLVGVNNRNLENFEVSLETGLRLGRRIPNGVVAVAESGIHSAEDVRMLADAGFHAFLVGESLLRSSDPGAALSSLIAACTFANGKVR